MPKEKHIVRGDEYREDGDTFGAKIRNHRMKLGYSQDYVASKIGIHQSLLSTYEWDIHTPSLYIATCIADFYGLSLDYLAGRKVK